MLKEKGIPHYTRRLMDGMQIQYYGNVKTTNNAIIALKYETNCQKAEKFLDLIEPYATKSQKEMLTKAIDEKRDYVADIVRKDGKVFSDIIKHYIDGGSDFVMKYSFANEPAAISALTELGKQKAGRYR